MVAIPLIIVGVMVLPELPRIMAEIPHTVDQTVLTVLQQTTVETRPTIITTHMVERLVTMEGILPITHSTVGRKPSNDKKKAPDWGFFILKIILVFV